MMTNERLEQIRREVLKDPVQSALPIWVLTFAQELVNEIDGLRAVAKDLLPGVRVWRDRNGDCWMSRGDEWCLLYANGDFWRFNTCNEDHMNRWKPVELFGHERDVIVAKVYGAGGIPGQVAKDASSEGSASVPPASWQSVLARDRGECRITRRVVWTVPK